MDGVGDGFNVGAGRGLGVGVSLGIDDGTALGEGDGRALGVCEGTGVGGKLGKGNGPALGSVVGMALGDDVGAVVGTELGCRLTVGAEEGTASMLPPERQTAKNNSQNQRANKNITIRALTIVDRRREAFKALAGERVEFP